MTIEDSAYYRRRAAQEREFADASTEPEVARIHARLADEYTARAQRAADPRLEPSDPHPSATLSRSG